MKIESSKIKLTSMGIKVNTKNISQHSKVDEITVKRWLKGVRPIPIPGR